MRNSSGPLIVAFICLALGMGAAFAQLAQTGAGSVANGGGGGTGNDLLANTGQPIFSIGTTPILVQ